MTNKEKYELGFELISGMHAEIQDQDIDYGRLATADGLTIDPECPPEYLDSHKRSVELANIRVEKQASFMAEVAVNKLIQMGYNVLKR